MGKWSKYDKAFQQKWLIDPTLSGWLEEKVGNKSKALCKICKVELRAHKHDLMKHMQTDKHKANASAIEIQPNISKVFPRVDKKTAITTLELRLALFVSCHTAIRTIDHLSELFKNETSETKNCSDNIIKNLKLHRTKCSALIKNVIAPSLYSAQINDLKNTRFSLIVDESTDVSSVKYLCVCIRYFNERKNKIVSQFLGLISVVGTTAVELYNHLKDFFSQIQVDLKNCFALATDGGNNLCGCYSSLYTLMKKDNPNLVLVKCVCHSLHLSCSYAAAELPSNLDYMLRETYNWFKRSTVKKQNYLELYKLINDGEEPLQLVQLSKTRWLARSKSVKRILDQWESLKLQFQLAAAPAQHNSKVATSIDESDGSSDCSQDRYLERELHKMYEDPSNLLYFTFMHPILEEFEEINLKFQSDNLDHFYLFEELETFALGLFGRILRPIFVKTDADFSFNSIYLSIDKVDFGYKFTNLAETYLKNKVISLEALQNLKLRCHNFLITACKQVAKRLAANTTLLKKIRNLSPKICLEATRPSFSELPLELANPTNLPIIERQWRSMLSPAFKSNFPEDISEKGDTNFWLEVIKIKNSLGELAMKEIAVFALTVQSFPISNATVERVFSRVNLTKTKLRSRMGTELLSSIIRIKTILEEEGKCCHNFDINADMLSYNSSIYENYKPSEDEEDIIQSLSL